jgi:ribose transport system permease protein
VTAAVDARAPGPAAGAADARRGQIMAWIRRNAWGLGLLAVLAGLLLVTKAIHPSFGAFDLETLARASLPLGLAAVAQALVVIAGGIDLSIGTVMAFTSILGAVLMQQVGDPASIGVVVLVLAVGVVVGLINGALVVVTRVPDIIVTLATSFIWGGAALLVLSRPGGNTADWLESLASGGLIVDFIPKVLVVLVVVVAVVWLPLRRSRLGLSLYAVGSDRLAAFRSGVDVERTKVASYALAGLFSGAAGLALTMVTGIGSPVQGPYTLAAVAAIVLGGVSLAGGQGGLLGPIAAAITLALIRQDLIFLGVDANYSVVIQGAIMVVVVMLGAWLILRRQRA